MTQLRELQIHLVVDEVQDINPIQRELIEILTGKSGKLTAVGDHRQSIYGFRGARIEIIAELWESFKKTSDSEVVDLQENFPLHAESHRPRQSLGGQHLAAFVRWLRHR